jgi:hypothetical protein
MGKMISPEMYREMSPPQLGYVFVPDDDAFIDTEHYLEISFVQFGPDAEAPAAVTAWISRTTDGIFEPLAFEPIIYEGVQMGQWIAPLPTLHRKGQRWFYYLEVETSTGRKFEIWKDMNWFERLFSGFTRDKQHFWTTYEGNIVREAPMGRTILATHIVLAFGALMFLVHTLYFNLNIFARKSNGWFLRAYRSLFWAWLSFTIGTIALGIPITWYTFGVGFMPWPTQGLTNPGDITDTKSSALVVFWAILLLSYFRAYRASLSGTLDFSRARNFAIWTFIAILATVVVFMIPHSQFMQSNV